MLFRVSIALNIFRSCLIACYCNMKNKILLPQLKSNPLLSEQDACNFVINDMWRTTNDLNEMLELMIQNYRKFALENDISEEELECIIKKARKYVRNVYLPEFIEAPENDNN